MPARDNIEQELAGESMGAFVRTYQDGGVEDDPHRRGRKPGRLFRIASLMMSSASSAETGWPFASRPSRLSTASFWSGERSFTSRIMR
ncbi:hypothetical protein SBA6_350018 [Candidatus Sulfopaludibacter sp. SbA6]|nr:hypothetical protein SBA6_350018 [Candidatus Sulfopaludibacter sp. SbA6]